MTRLLCSESLVGRHYVYNYDRLVADVAVPLFAVIDSECDDGSAGDTVVQALRDAGAELARAGIATVERATAVLVEALHEAHRVLVAAAHRGGAAVTAVTRVGNVVVVAHVGDCRLYVRGARGWVRKTRDHTLLEQSLAAGSAPSDPETRSQQLGVISRTVGVSRGVDVETLVLPLPGPTDILLCTRGAWLPLDRDGSARPLPSTLDGEQAMAFVLDQYRRDGERDNATLVVARLEPSS